MCRGDLRASDRASALAGRHGRRPSVTFAEFLRYVTCPWLAGYIAEMRSPRPSVALAFVLPLCVCFPLSAAHGAESPPPATRPTAGPAAPDDWLDAATGHRVTRLSRVAGSSTGLYFHQ